MCGCHISVMMHQWLDKFIACVGIITELRMWSTLCLNQLRSYMDAQLYGCIAIWMHSYMDAYNQLIGARIKDLANLRLEGNDIISQLFVLLSRLPVLALEGVYEPEPDCYYVAIATYILKCKKCIGQKVSNNLLGTQCAYNIHSHSHALTPAGFSAINAYS